MKKIYFLIALLPVFFNAFSQNISGTVYDEKGNQLPGASISLSNSYAGTVSDAAGNYRISKLKKWKYGIHVSAVGYEQQDSVVEISNDDITLNFHLKLSDILTDEVTVSALRATHNTPIAYSNLNTKEIAENNIGRDVPYLLDFTPSTVSNSDAGTGVGYTTLRVRGTDITRINVTLDGIPVNDAESHGVWWVDLPDYSSSTDDIQIQRGAGTSTNGAAAFGANINFRTNVLKKNPYAQTDYSYGSFNTQKTTLKAGTGLLNNHFSFDARLSEISSDGYIDRASSDLKSYFISGVYVDKKNMFRINVFQGLENTYQAWYGVPKDSLKTNRTYNPYTYDNQVDNYNQTNYQAFYTRELNRNLNFNVAVHYTKGFGYYEEYKKDQAFADYGLENITLKDTVLTSTDLIRRKWLNNDFYGGIYSINYTNKNLNIIFGGAANQYSGEHYGQIIWSRYAGNSEIRHEWYRNKGLKNDINNYLKLSYAVSSKINLWADLQYRIVRYKIDGVRESLENKDENHDYTFFNPKAGINFDFNENQNVYFSFATAHREPSRQNFDDADAGHQPKPESLQDFEAGYKFSSEQSVLTFGLYFMNYKDQLALTGEINDVGDAVMVNVPESYRAGIEITGGHTFFGKLKWSANAAFSQNKIKKFTEYVDNWDASQQIENYLGTTDLSFSPDIVAGNKFDFNFYKRFSIILTSKYVSQQFIDNTSSKVRSLDPYFVNNLMFQYDFKLKSIKEISFRFEINNLLNAQYETNAWVYRYYSGGQPYEENGYFPQAGINFTAAVGLIF
jgi:iron complex outermembrane receptor protein